MIDFFKKEEETRIVEAIREAERNTSGEIRVHLDDDCKGPIMEEAIRTFGRLKMHRTEARNGVLIFLATERHEFAIIGDEGIDRVTGEDFWREERDLMQAYFRRGAFCEGLCLAIGQVGEKLKTYFPYQSDDINELPDEISYNQKDKKTPDQN